MNIALLALRIVVGLTFAGHGAQKLFGFSGGPGLEGTAGGFERMGLGPPLLLALAAGSAEFGGGLLIALGLVTTPAAALVIGVMTTAILTVHVRKGFWNAGGGLEYNLVLIAVAFALAGVGAGAWSLDHAIGVGLTGTGWALGALAVGLVGGVGAVLGGRLLPQRPGRDPHTSAA
jgi:putative oxidoreductase